MNADKEQRLADTRINHPSGIRHGRNAFANPRLSA